MNSEQIYELLKAYEEFVAVKQTSNLNEFADWLKYRQFEDKISKTIENTNDLKSEDQDSLILYLMNRFNRYFKQYCKQLIRGLSVNSIDEFWLLNFVFLNKLASKTDIYQNTITDLPVGTKMLKRLLEVSLIDEQPDPIDRRIRRLTITKKGIKERNIIIERMNKMSRFSLGSLDYLQKSELLKTLKYLDIYHNNLYKNNLYDLNEEQTEE